MNKIPHFIIYFIIYICILYSHGYCLRPTGFSLISEWQEYNLRTILTEKPDSLDWRNKLCISLGVANAIKYCHEQNILHYDLRR